MNNPFSLPDEVVNAIISAVIKQQQEVKKSYKSENAFKADIENPVDMAKKSASMAKQFYDAYAEVGFTQEQAFELVKAILAAKNN